MSYIVQKGEKTLSSVYLNDLGYKRVDSILKPQINKLFVFRQNSAILFDSVDDFNKSKEYWINEIEQDDRYTSEIKISLIKSVNKLINFLVEH